MYEEEIYEDILDRMLDRTPDSMDKRQSSFLYNSNAPVAVELQNVYLALDNILNLMSFDTSDRQGKLDKCKDRGIDLTQFDPTQSVVVIDILPATVEIPIGSSFNYDEVNFVITEKVTDGSYLAQCDTAGTVGNVTGSVLPLDYFDGLESATISSIHQWGEDEADETVIDDAFYASLNSQAFGGNKADYKEKLKKIPGVGGVKPYSANEWQGNGNVGIVFTTSAFTKPSDTFVDSVQTQVDPIQNQGEGLGFAPIGHVVDVQGVNEESVDIGMNLTLQDGYTWDDVSQYVNEAIDSYFTSLNAVWEDLTNIIVRISQIETRILNIAGVIDIDSTTINGAENNLTVDKDSIVVRGNVNATTT